MIQTQLDYITTFGIDHSKNNSFIDQLHYPSRLIYEKLNHTLPDNILALTGEYITLEIM
ncbi:MAG: hypothetical protein AB8B68_03490 [Rickettsiaceae bacterium]